MGWHSYGVLGLVGLLALVDCSSSSSGSTTSGTVTSPDGGTSSASSSSGASSGGPAFTGTIASGLYEAGPIAASSTDVYWTTIGGNVLMKAPLAGGAAVTVATVDPSLQGDGPISIGGGPESLAVSGTSVYWSSPRELGSSGGFAEEPSVVLQVPLAGGTPVTLATGATLVRVNSTNVVWAQTDTNNQSAIVAMPLAGGAPVTITASLADTLAVDDANVYWSSLNALAIQKAPLAAGATPSDLPGTASYANAQDLAVDATNLYVLIFGERPSTGAVVKIPLAGGAPVTLASAQDFPHAIAVDADSVYWTNTGAEGENDGAVVKVPIAGGTPVTLASADHLSAIAVAGPNAYYTLDSSAGLGTVVSIAK